MVDFPADLELTPELKDLFQSENGAGSIVGAGDEGKKAQITVTKSYERPIMESLVPSIPMGKKEDLGDSCLMEFRVFPSGHKIRLPLLYRPNHGGRDELRLYMKAGEFRPQANMYWFVFERDGSPWLASLTQEELGQIHLGKVLDLQDVSDANAEENYQDILNGRVPKQQTSMTTSYQRDSKVAQDALNASGFVCEMLPEQELFTSKRTGNPYLEAHHFFPMMEQRHFPDVSLDVAKNICILNPYAHKMVHHATYSEIEGHLKKLAEPREDFLNHIGVSVDRVLKSYGGP